MNLIDWILNLAGLFLWIDWRTGRAAQRPAKVISLASALRETGRRRSKGWSSLAGLVGLLLLRPFVYRSLGSSLEWTPVMDVLALSLPFRSDLIDRMFVYSTLSFCLTLGSFYSILLFLSAPPSKAPESEVLRRFLRAQLSFLDKLPWFAKMLLPFAGVALFWSGLVPALTRFGIMPAVPRPSILWAQAGIIALASVILWSWFFVILFLLQCVNTYVYLGAHPFWTFVSEVSAGFLKPLSFLRWGKFDASPFAAIILLVAAAELLRPWVVQLFQGTLR